MCAKLMVPGEVALVTAYAPRCVSGGGVRWGAAGAGHGLRIQVCESVYVCVKEGERGFGVHVWGGGAGHSLCTQVRARPCAYHDINRCIECRGHGLHTWVCAMCMCMGGRAGAAWNRVHASAIHARAIT